MEYSNIDISVIVPIWNNSETILETIESVSSQKLPGIALEIIIVDDSSVDDGLQKCSKIQSFYPVEIHALKNRSGQSHARNYGIEMSRGKYLLMLDGDDILIEGSIALLYSEIAREPNFDLVTGQRIEFGPWGMNIWKKYCGRDHQQISALILRGKNPFTHSGTLFKRDWFERSGKYNTKQFHAEDLDLWFRGMNTGTYLQIDIPTVYYRQKAYYRNYTYWKSSNSANLEALGKETRKSLFPLTQLISIFEYLSYLIKVFLLRQQNRFV